MGETALDNRRSFLRIAFKFFGGIAGLTAIWGLGRFSLFSNSRKRVREVARDVLKTLRPAVPFHVAGAGAWLVKAKNDGKILAFDDRCPHLGCRQKWNAQLRRYQCPCHGSEFDLNGAVLRGPAAKPMPRLFLEDSGQETIRLHERPPKKALPAQA